MSKKKTLYEGDIKTLRMSLGMTQESFAKALGCSRVTLARWETGVQLPRPEMYGRLIKLWNQ